MSTFRAPPCSAAPSGSRLPVAEPCGTSRSTPVFRPRSEEPANKTGGLFGYTVVPGLVPRPCRFCGATDRKITREHVWPRWLADFLPPTTGRVLPSDGVAASGGEEWQIGILWAALDTFCDTCNSGWMADIEGTARPNVGPMVQGRATRLDPDAQRTVANWAVLKWTHRSAD